MLLFLYLFAFRHLPVFDVNKKKKLLKDFYDRETEKGRCPADEIKKVLNPLYPYLLQDYHAIDVEDTINPFLRYIKIRWYWFWEVTKSLWTGYDNYQFTKRFGRDLAMYFQYQRLNIWTFTIITILGIIILIPLHTTGEIPPNYQEIDKQYMNSSVRSVAIRDMVPDKDILFTSVNMVIQSPSKMATHVILSYIFVFLLIGIVCVGLLRSDIVATFNYAGQDEPADPEYYNKFNIGYNSENGDVASNTTESRALLVSLFTVEILGLPSTLIKKSVLEKVVLSLVEDHDSIVHISLVHDFSKRKVLERQLQHFMHKLDHYEWKLEQLQQEWLEDPPKEGFEFEKAYINAQKLKEVKYFTRSDGGLKLYHEKDALQYYRDKIEWIKYKISRWDQCFREQTGENPSVDEFKRNSERNEDILVSVSVKATVEAEKDRTNKMSTWNGQLHKQRHQDELDVVVINDEEAQQNGDINGSGDKQYTITGSGVGYVTFTSLAALEKFMNNYRQKGFSLTYTCQKKQTELQMLKDIEEKDNNDQIQVEVSENNVNIHNDDRGKEIVPINSVSIDELEKQNMTETNRWTKKTEAIERQMKLSIEKKKKRKLPDIDKKFLTQAIEKMTIFINRINYESRDIEWSTLYTYHKLSRYLPILRKIILTLVMLVVLVFFSSPLAVVSAVQQILSLLLVKDSIVTIKNATGIMGSLFFQYLPTLLLLIVSSIMPSIISVITTVSKQKTVNKAKRHLLKYFFIYLLLSTLILPTMLLSSVSAIINYILAFKNFWQALSNLFIPSSGTFFINYVLQKALLKNALDLIRIDMLIYYTIKTRFTKHTKLYIYYGLCCFLPWCYHRHNKTVGKRYLTPQKKLYIAEFWWIALFTEWEFPYILSIAAISLVYSVFSPIVLPASLLYFILKWYLDRYVICYHYGHRIRQPYQKSSDFLANRKNAHQLVRIVLSIAIIFCIYLCFFFGTKIAGNAFFIIHVIFSALLGTICVIALIIFNILSKIWLNSARHLLNKDRVRDVSEQDNNDIRIHNQVDPNLTFEDIRKDKDRFYDPPMLFEVLVDHSIENDTCAEISREAVKMTTPCSSEV